MSEQLVITEQGATELLEIAQQGPGGPPGPAGAPGGALLVGTAGEALSGHQAVAYNAAGQLVKADAGNPSHSLLFAGVTLGAAAAGAVAEVQQRDVINFAGWTWVPNQPVFLGLAGALVQTPPAGAVFLLLIGIALTPTRLVVGVQPAVIL